MTNALDWFEIPARDLDRAQRFYETLLGAHAAPRGHGRAATLAVFPYDEAGAAAA